MLRRALWGLGTAALAASLLTPALARPNYLTVFKAHYNTANGKTTLNGANCSLCHIGAANTGKWNAYGEAVRTALAGKTKANNQEIEAALVAAESKSAPGSRQNFGRQIAADRLPGQGRNGGNAQLGPGPQGFRTQWQELFNGRDMSNFSVKNQGNWEVRDGLLRYTGGGNGWLSTNQQYRNYCLVVVWRYPNAGDNDSGIFLKASGNGNPWPDGANWQLNMGPGQNLGSIGGTQGSRSRADLIHPNDWNTYQVTVQNGVATLAINGEKAWDKATGIPDRPGYLGIQAENKVIEIRQFAVLPLP